MNTNKEILKLVNELSLIYDIDSILLSGSQTTKYFDNLSDFDIYIYVKNYLSYERRKTIYEKYFTYYEIDNNFWEKEDEAVFKDNKKGIEIIYRKFSWLDNVLKDILIKHNAKLGYTTCFWYNLLSSEILFDREGNAEKIKNKYMIPFPKELKENIIKKNYLVLKDSLPSYYSQIEKAIKRNDIVSINHRVSAFLASYFDIIYAINEKTNPGEKQLLKIASDTCKKLPNNLKEDIEGLLKNISYSKNKIMTILDHLVENIKQLIKEENINIILHGA